MAGIAQCTQTRELGKVTWATQSMRVAEIYRAQSKRQATGRPVPIDAGHPLRMAARSMFFKTSETYARGVYIPASLMSNGTINLIAIITALYFEDHPLVILEEPERNVHPFLMSKLVGMLKDASSTKKQILISTHNPEIVRYADLASLILVSRRKDGSSELTRPNEKESVNNFLKEEIGIEDLYVNDLLGVGS